MKVKTRRSNFAFAAATACAVLAGVMVWQLAVRISHTQKIVVSTHYIPPFTRIQAADVKTVLVPTDTGISTLQVDPSAVVGHYSTFPIPAGYPVTAEAMSTSSSFSDFLTEYEQQTGQTGTELFLNATTPAEKLIQPGEQVELLVPQSNPGGQVSFSTYVVRVLNVLGSPPATLGLFIPDSISATVSPSVLSGGVQAALISQQGTYATAPAEPVSPGKATLSSTTPQITPTVGVPSQTKTVSAKAIQSTPTVSATTNKPVTIPPPGPGQVVSHGKSHGQTGGTKK